MDSIDQEISGIGIDLGTIARQHSKTHSKY
jgi:hypothetical protein